MDMLTNFKGRPFPNIYMYQITTMYTLNILQFLCQLYIDNEIFKNQFIRSVELSIPAVCAPYRSEWDRVSETTPTAQEFLTAPVAQAVLGVLVGRVSPRCTQPPVRKQVCVCVG